MPKSPWLPRIAVVACIGALGFAGAQADDWPQWRGARHDGISRETGWDYQQLDDGPDILWRREVGTGFSSVAVSDGRLYTMGNTGTKGRGKKTDQRDTVWCFDAKTGREIWRQTYPCPLEPKWYEGGPSATPTILDGRCYTVSKAGDVFCFNAATGSVMWRRHLYKHYAVKPPEWGFAGSAIIIGDFVVLNAGTHGSALSKQDGAPAWINGKEEAGYSSAVPYEHGGQWCAALLGKAEIYGVAVETGEVLWTHPWKTKHGENITDPIVTGEKVFISTGLGTGAAVFRITDDGLVESWAHKDLQTWLNTAVLWQGHLYGADSGRAKALICVDFETGAVKWSGPDLGNGGAIVADGKLVALGEKGTLRIAKATPAGYEELASARVLQGKCWTVPVLADGRIYARNAAGELVCIDVRGVD